jgi:hypothetical protein
MDIRKFLIKCLCFCRWGNLRECYSNRVPPCRLSQVTNCLFVNKVMINNAFKFNKRIVELEPFAIGACLKLCWVSHFFYLVVFFSNSLYAPRIESKPIILIILLFIIQVMSCGKDQVVGDEGATSCPHPLISRHEGKSSNDRWISVFKSYSSSNRNNSSSRIFFSFE